MTLVYHVNVVMMDNPPPNVWCHVVLLPIAPLEKLLNKRKGNAVNLTVLTKVSSISLPFKYIWDFCLTCAVLSIGIKLSAGDKNVSFVKREYHVLPHLCEGFMTYIDPKYAVRGQRLFKICICSANYNHLLNEPIWNLKNVAMLGTPTYHHNLWW